MAKVKKWLTISLITLAAIITLRDFEPHVKLAITAALAFLAHLSSSDYANYVLILYYALLIGSWAYDRFWKKNAGQS